MGVCQPVRVFFFFLFPLSSPHLCFCARLGFYYLRDMIDNSPFLGLEEGVLVCLSQCRDAEMSFCSQTYLTS